MLQPSRWPLRLLPRLRRFASLASISDSDLDFDATGVQLEGFPRLSHTWLRHHDARGVHPSSGQRIPLSAQTIAQASIIAANNTRYAGCRHVVAPSCYNPQSPTTDNTWKLRIVWQDDDEISEYDGVWLEECFQETPPIQMLHPDTQIYETDYAPVMEQDDALLQVYQAMFAQGAVILNQVPQGVLESLTLRLSGQGPSHGDLYGNIFDVISAPHSHNIANTSLALEPHQDLVYYQAPPGLQLLHCLEAAEGGASTLVDGIGVAQLLQSQYPDAFQTLTQIPVTFHKQRENADLVYRKPHIQTYDDQVVAMNWAPPFEGPLQTHRQDEYYAARQVLCDLIQNHVWQYPLQPGQLLVFNNLRLLHGRTAFEGCRQLQGCYANLDAVLHQYRLLHPTAPIPVTGNGSL